MLNLLSSIPFVKSELKADVEALQNMVYEINDLQIADTIAMTDWSCWDKKRRMLERKISDFNEKQFVESKRNSEIDSSLKLLPLYLENHTYIKATQKISKGSKSNVFITYQEKTLGFSEFFRSQYQLYNKYAKMRNCFSALAFCIYENAEEHCYGNILVSFERENPYQYVLHSSLIGYEIKKESVNNIGKVKRCLTDIFLSICGDDIAPITGKIARRFILGICMKESVEALIDAVFLTYVYIKKGVTFNEFKIDISYGISRHVAWCCYRGKNKECILLGQPCHASVDCAFYREDKAKKEHLK